MDKSYIAIDLKSFYASVECVQRGLDPLNTHLVVADPSRTEKTICLAVSPSLKRLGLPGRARLFEVVQKVNQVNQERTYCSGLAVLKGKSFLESELEKDPALAVDYIVAPPQMAKYMEVSSRIYGTYLKYVAPEDIFAYSVDEVFIDATGYLKTYGVPAHDFARMLIRDVLDTTGITATAGIGTNMYLCKVAMDIEAKHIPADKDGVRIAELTEQSYRESLWSHRPLTDFWRVGRGIAARVEKLGMRTMGDIARCSLDRKTIGLLYQVLGKNAELLIDHAWGIEPTSIADVKAYTPSSSSISTGQVLKEPTDYETTKLIVWEMADVLSLDLVEKGFVTDQIVLTIGYDKASLDDGQYTGEVKTDFYGRTVPKHAHGSKNLEDYTSSTKKITEATMDLFEQIMDKHLFSRRIGIAACNLQKEGSIPENKKYRQMSIFDLEQPKEDDGKKDRASSEEASEKERALQEAMLGIKKKYGKNAVVKVKNLTKGGTAIERNNQIGGHKA
ncbi:MAG: DNA methylase [Clostridiales bacterium]|nr:DNA methylase [Clostridiales bacterium]